MAAGAIVPFRSSGAAADQTAPMRLVQVAGVALHLEQDPQHSHALPASTAPAAAAGAQADWLIDVEAQEHAAASASASTGPAGSAASAAAPPAQAHLANVGLVLWQSGLVLAQLLVERPPFGPAGWAGVHVLDLGAGTGVVGLALARHGAGRVTLTDLPHILPLLARNVEANVGGGAGEAAVVGAAWRVVVAEHRWGEDVAPLLQQVGGSRPDVITAADVLYDASQHGPLLASVAALSAPHTVTFVAWRRRSVLEERFAELAEAAGFAVEVVPDALLAEEYQGGAYAVLRLARRDGGGGTVAPGGAVEGAVANTVVEVGGAGGAPAGEAAEEDEPGENLEHKPCRQQ